jgi:hypothetical protein
VTSRCVWHERSACWASPFNAPRQPTTQRTHSLTHTHTHAHTHTLTRTQAAKNLKTLTRFCVAGHPRPEHFKPVIWWRVWSSHPSLIITCLTTAPRRGTAAAGGGGRVTSSSERVAAGCLGGFQLRAVFKHCVFNLTACVGHGSVLFFISAGLLLPVATLQRRWRLEACDQCLPLSRAAPYLPVTAHFLLPGPRSPWVHRRLARLYKQALRRAHAHAPACHNMPRQRVNHGGWGCEVSMRVSPPHTMPTHTMPTPHPAMPRCCWCHPSRDGTTSSQ